MVNPMKFISKFTPEQDPSEKEAESSKQTKINVFLVLTVIIDLPESLK